MQEASEAVDEELDVLVVDAEEDFRSSLRRYSGVLEEPEDDILIKWIAEQGKLVEVVLYRVAEDR